MPFPTGGAPPEGGGNMMRDLQGLMKPGGMQPDQLGAGGEGVDVQGLVDQIMQAPPEILQLLKQVIDEKLAGSAPGGGESLPPEQM